ncbi:MAG: DNA translocase FtsK [Planctomycetota bacterium]|nr:MAG: DNA translocase FtsK [Planctomycetota bacterium]
MPPPSQIARPTPAGPTIITGDAHDPRPRSTRQQREPARIMPARRPTPPEHAPVWRWTLTLGAVALWLLLAASLLSHDPADTAAGGVVPPNPDPANWIGPVGAYVSEWLIGTLGVGVWALLAGTGLWLGLAVARRPVGQPALRLVGLTTLALAISGAHALFWPNSGDRPEGAGGLVAIAAVHELTLRFGVAGTAVWLALAAGVGAVLAFDQWVVRAPAALARRLAPAVRAMSLRLMARMGDRRRAHRVRQTDLDEEDRPARSRPHAAGAGARRSAHAPAAQPDPEEDLPGAPQVFDADAAREKIAGLPVRFASAARAESTEDHLRDIQNAAVMENYRFPGLDLLEDPEESFSEEMEQHVREQAEALEEALRVYKIDGEVVGIDSGPVITLFEVRLAPGTKVSRLTAVSSDIARALKTINIRIVPNMAGRDTVGVEAPNLKKEKVRLKELMTCAQDADRVARMRLPMFLGKDASGEPLIEDLAQAPHVLIAGTTGSGKSVCLNTIIMGFLFTKKPNELKLVLIDPKMVELSAFRDIPHLMCPVVTEMSKAAAILEWAVAKMDERYELLAEAGVRDIGSYNELDEEELLERMAPASEREAASIPRRLPYLVFVIDELADLMMTHKEVEGAIVRIAQKARAVGIHLVLATQRPQANVVTGLIKSNMPARMTFKVASGMDSRIVLDQKGGELLLGQGDMLFLSPRSHKLIRAQGTLVDDRETRRVVRFLKDVAAPTFERQLVQLRAPGEDAPEEHEARGLQSALEDPLFERAVDIVLETKRGSVSLLQRRLAIGYTRASRLVDLMGEVGVIGAYKGTVAREVVVTPEQWEEMRAQLRALADGQPELFDTTAPAETPAPAAAAAGDARASIDDDEDADEEGADEAEDWDGVETDDQDDESDEEWDDEEDDEEDEAEDGEWDEDEEDWDEEEEEDDDDAEDEDDEPLGDAAPEIHTAPVRPDAPARRPA